jgi:hypothetical protein
LLQARDKVVGLLYVDRLVEHGEIVFGAEKVAAEADQIDFSVIAFARGSR